MVLVFGLGLWSSNAQTVSLDGWEFYNSSNSSVEVVRSSNAQEGENLLVINGTELEFPVDYESVYSQFGPKAYLIQTIEVSQLKGKHFHVSGFARSLVPDFSKLEHWFIEKVTEFSNAEFETRIVDLNHDEVKELRIEFNTRLQEKLKLKLKSFSKAIKSSHTKADFGIWVLLHMGDENFGEKRIQRLTPTSSSKSNQDKFWNRFNVEVSVPVDCKAVSIVLWSEGINMVEFDHIAFVAHGPSLALPSSFDELYYFDGIYDRFKKRPLIIQSEFSNPSFEN